MANVLFFRWELTKYQFVLPPFNSNVTTSMWCVQAAKCNGLFPKASFIFGLAPYFNNNLNIEYSVWILNKQHIFYNTFTNLRYKFTPQPLHILCLQPNVRAYVFYCPNNLDQHRSWEVAPVVRCYSYLLLDIVCDCLKSLKIPNCKLFVLIITNSNTALYTTSRLKSIWPHVTTTRVDTARANVVSGLSGTILFLHFQQHFRVLLNRSQTLDDRQKPTNNY